jgi:hypothetical protein
MPEPVFDAAKAEVGSRLKIVTSVKSSDNSRFFIGFIISPFSREATKRAGR